MGVIRVPISGNIVPISERPPNVPWREYDMRWLVHLLLIKMWPSRVGPEARIHALELENLALRQQLAVIQRTSKRPKVTQWDRVFWIGLSRIWPGWKSV